MKFFFIMSSTKLVLTHTASSFIQYEVRQVHRPDFDYLGIVEVNSKCS